MEQSVEGPFEELPKNRCCASCEEGDERNRGAVGGAEETDVDSGGCGPQQEVSDGYASEEVHGDVDVGEIRVDVKAPRENDVDAEDEDGRPGCTRGARDPEFQTLSGEAWGIRHRGLRDNG